MTVWVTGACGLIGSHVCKKLIENINLDVISIDLNIIPDLSDYRAAEKLKELSKPDVIVHCAAAIPLQGFDENDVVNINRRIDENIYNCAKQANAKVVFMSGISVYEDYGRDILLVEEKTPLRSSVEDSYFNEKLNSENCFRELGNACIFRISSPYGSGQKNRNVLKIFIENAKMNKDIVYFGNGERTQDFIHASDIADAVCMVIEKKVVGLFNIAYGKSISMKQLAEKVVSCTPDYLGKVYSNGEIDKLADFRVNIDNKKAKDVFGWCPATSIKAGIMEMMG